MSRPIAIGIATLFCLIAGLYLGYHQGRLDGREEIINIRLKPLADDMALLGTGEEVLDILLENDPLERAGRLAPKLLSLGPESLPQVLDAYEAVFVEIGDIEFELLADWWARFDPRGALDHTRNRWELERPGFGRAVIRQWASREPIEAMQATAETDALSSSPYILSGVTGWDESGRPGLEEFIYGMGPGHQRQRALMQIIQRTARRDGPEAAIEWAEALPGRGRQTAITFKLNAIRRAGRAAAKLDPELAIAFTERHWDMPHAKGLASWVGTEFSRSDDPSTGLAWLSTLPAGVERDRAVEDAYRGWARKQPTASMAWAEQQPIEAEWFQPALSVFARQTARIDIDQGLALARQVDHPTLWLMTMGRIVREWIVVDRAAALAWLEQSDLDENVKKKILAIERRDGRLE
ncbi:MAG: hypothetical protein VCC04_02735 [Myxococcota bacterium]